jgi:hypothetical protein
LYSNQLFLLIEEKPMAQQFEKDSERDIRVTATSKIWGLATGMLAICIPLTAVAKGNPILPLAVITGAAVGTVAVWQPSDKKSPNSTLSPNRLETLEERIANLETIIGTDEVNFQRRLKQLDSTENF